MDNDFTPFGMSSDQIENYRALYEGVPEWMREPIVEWVSNRGVRSDVWRHPGLWLEAQVALRMDLGVRAGMGEFDLHYSTVVSKMRALPQLELLRVADYWARKSGTPDASANRLLELILGSSGSKWKVGERGSGTGLVERVPEGVQAAVEGVISDSGTAGQILMRSWGHVHGIEPNDSAGYADAVRAVEIAASEVVAPEDTTATLGKRLGQMKVDGDWRLDLRQHGEAPSQEMLLMMIRTLWFGHRDRHGSADYTDVTHEEAAQAVLLAAALVGWFSSGAISRRPA